MLSAETAETKRLVLGFDAGCCTCTGIAKRIEERVGDKLEVMSLRSPQIEEWRKKALGENAPWTPTLFEVEGTKVRAWTGWRMGVQLRRSIGLVGAWRVMQVLGEISVAPEVQEGSLAARVVGGMTRAQFLKGVGGTAVALSVLSVISSLARTAKAATITDTNQLVHAQLASYAALKASSPDMLNTGPGADWSAGMMLYSDKWYERC